MDPNKPPIGGTWRNLYLIVLALHVLFLALFYWITRLYS